ncbi:CARDB domain-containing protein [Halosolutus amylolyticus]|uniref:CARDB domain-containing protein n=1 Tax=Halosolutus amylolyticus TaxID=2932267 RepID=A0ABD5PJE6_9EURY|nr:CARDB domain-containing protein [Halosolutus amylolyticus]
MNARLSLVLVVCLLVAAGPANVGVIAATGSPAPSAGPDATVTTTPFVAVAGGATGSTATVSQTDDVLHRTTVLRHRPDRPGEFEAEMTFRVPDPVTELEIELESEASVDSIDGFEPTGDGTYRWTETTDEPTVRFTMPTDRTGDGHADGSADRTVTPSRDDAGLAQSRDGDGYTFVDTGDWAVVQVPGVGLSLRQTASVGIEETVTVDGPGATGGDIAYFGPVTEYERTGDRERVRLAVADDAELRESPAEILDAVVAASDRFDVGASHDEVFLVAVPSDDVEWAARGIQYGESDAWVVADAPLDEANTVWLHEYVHARQAFANPDVGTTTETAWLVEAQAEYYAGLFALEAGLVGFDEFADALGTGEREPYADATLAEPATWTDDRTDYVKGALVYGEIDRRLRLATDGDRTLADVVRTLNRDDGPVTEDDFLAAVEAEGGADVRSVAERYTRTDRTPEMWTRTAHEAAFEGPVAQFEYDLDAAPIEVGGEPWGPGEPADADAVDEVAVPAGEPVTVPVAIRNVGDRDGTADATLVVDGDVVDHRPVELAAGDRTTDAFTWTPPKPGVYDLRVGSDRLTVHVRSPASVAVTGLAVDPETADPGEDVTATATVEAADDRPGATVLAFRTPAGDAAEVPVVVAPGERETVATTLSFADAGRYEVAVGDRTTTVTIGSSPIDRVEDVPGFGVPAAIASLAALVLSLVAVHGRRA